MISSYGAQVGITTDSPQVVEEKLIGSYLFLTRLLTSEDEYKWYWHQMIYFTETINAISTTDTMLPTHSLVSS